MPGIRMLRTAGGRKSGRPVFLVILPVLRYNLDICVLAGSEQKTTD